MYINSHAAIMAVCDTTKESKSLLIYDDVVKHVKAFGGDIYGSYLRDWRIRGVPAFGDLDIRINPCMLTVFTNILSMKYKLKVVTYKTVYSKTYRRCYEVCDTTNEAHNKVKLDILCCDKMDWRKWYADFDVNTLAEDAKSMFVRNPIQGVVDMITHVKERICEQRFCTVARPLYNMKRFEIHQSVKVDRAIQLLQRGWRMDDNIFGSETWVVFDWKDIDKHIAAIRTDFVKEQREQLLSRCICAICHEEFKDGDIVINTKCNHNFHWQCPKSQDASGSSSDSDEEDTNKHGHGLKHWVLKNEKHSCPTCREKMF